MGILWHAASVNVTCTDEMREDAIRHGQLHRNGFRVTEGDLVADLRALLPQRLSKIVLFRIPAAGILVAVSHCWVVRVL